MGSDSFRWARALGDSWRISAQEVRVAIRHAEQVIEMEAFFQALIESGAWGKSDVETLQVIVEAARMTGDPVAYMASLASLMASGPAPACSCWWCRLRRWVRGGVVWPGSKR